MKFASIAFGGCMFFSGLLVGWASPLDRDLSARRSAAHAEAPTEPAPSTPTAAPEEHAYVDVLHHATFKGDQLAFCNDTGETYSGRALSAGWRPDRSLRQFFDAASEADRKDRVILPKPCAEQFAGMTPLASCRVVPGREPADDGVFVERTFDITYYRYADVFDSHAAMKKCLEHTGSWQAVAVDSDEYRRARLARHAGQAMGLAKQLGALSGQ
jgi:hypothetical protein